MLRVLDDLDVVLPTKWAICDACRGEGTRALHGYDVTEMIREDPDFGEDYFAGLYDTPCVECRGSGKVKVYDEDRLDADQLAEVRRAAAEDDEYRALCEAERRFGC